MKALVYKRTHADDPDESGCFGIFGCMKGVREWDFGAVIGIGGISREPITCEINEKVNWIGIGPVQVGIADDGFRIVAFEHFYLKNADGPNVYEYAPKMAKQMFAKNIRRMMIDSENPEIKAMLRLARNSPPSPVIGRKSSNTKACKPQRRHTSRQSCQ